MTLFYSFLIIILCIGNETGLEEKLIVNHLQFTKWPNYGVPDSVGPISDFIKLVHQKANELEAKDPELVIHCR